MIKHLYSQNTYIHIPKITPGEKCYDKIIKWVFLCAAQTCEKKVVHLEMTAVWTCLHGDGDFLRLLPSFICQVKFSTQSISMSSFCLDGNQLPLSTVNISCLKFRCVSEVKSSRRLMGTYRLAQVVSRHIKCNDGCSAGNGFFLPFSSTGITPTEGRTVDGRERETESVKRKEDKKIQDWTKGERRRHGFL